MATDYSEITDPEKLLDVIHGLADEQAARAAQIKALTIRAVRELGARRYAAAASAAVSRPTLNAWLAEAEETK